MLLNTFEFHTPTSLKEASKLYCELEHVKIQAGGTFLLNNLKLAKRRDMKSPEHVISLYKVTDLKGIKANDKELLIKSMTTISELAKSDDLIDNFAILKQVCKNISTQQIRNMATVGGNLTCRYTWTEMPAVMISLNATMHFISADGKENPLSAEDFFAAQAKTEEILSHITIPREKNARLAYQRVRKSLDIDIPLCSLLIKTDVKNNQFKDTRIGVNNCVQFAQRDTKLENFLNGKNIDEGIVEEALSNLTDTIYDTRSSDYKSHIFRISIKNALKEIIHQK